MDEQKLNLYNEELKNSMNQLSLKLAECQKIMGILESFLYLVRKESQVEIKQEN